MEVTMEGRKKLERKLKKAAGDVKTNVDRAVARVGEDLATDRARVSYGVSRPFACLAKICRSADAPAPGTGYGGEEAGRVPSPSGV